MRYISLLEFKPGLTTLVVPPHSVLEKTNGTLVQQNCILRVDAQGFMVSDKPCAASSAKVLLLGGSSIENLYIPDHQRVGGVIEASVTKFGKDVKVYSAGISNAHLLHNINILLNKGLGLRPQFVVYYLTPGSDIAVNEIDGSFWNPNVVATPIRVAGEDAKYVFSAHFQNKNKFSDEKRLLAILATICKSFGITLLLATWPIYGDYDSFMEKYCPDREAFEAEEQQTLALNQVVREAGAEHGVEILDLERYLADVDHHEHFYDWNHPNVKGCELIGSLTSLALHPHL